MIQNTVLSTDTYNDVSKICIGAKFKSETQSNCTTDFSIIPGYLP